MTPNKPDARVEAALFAFLKERSAQMGERFDMEMFKATKECDPDTWDEEMAQMACALAAADAVGQPAGEDEVERVALAIMQTFINKWVDELGKGTLSLPYLNGVNVWLDVAKAALSAMKASRAEVGWRFVATLPQPPKSNRKKRSLLMPINYETHWSDCGKYNEPAYKNIECTCALERLIHKIEHTRAFIDAQGYLDDSEEWKALRAEADALIRRVFAAELQPTPPAVTPDHSPDATKMVALPRAELERILACIMFICHRDARWIDEPMVKEALKILSAAMEGKDA